MIKLSLIIYILLFVQFTLFAQEIYKIPACLSNARIFVDSPLETPKIDISVIKSKSKASAMIEMTSSANVYTVFYPFIRPLSYNQDANLLQFMHRGDPSVGIGKSKSDIIATISSDGGKNWEDIVVADDNTKNHRHPSGVIFNPTHSKDYTQTKAVFCGPVTDEVVWTENFFGSINLDKTNKKVDYVKQPDQVAMQGLTLCDDAIAHVLGLKIDTNALGEGTQVSSVMNNGKYNAGTNSFDWTNKIISPSWPQDKNGKIIFPGSSNQAWSTDGTIGYIFFIGIDSLIDLITPQPIVFKSINQGETWSRLKTYNFSKIKGITKYLNGTLNDTSVKKPYFSDETISGEVDYNGNLHIFSQIMERTSIHSDSLGYFYAKLLLYDVFTKNDSVWDATVISFLKTRPVSENDRVFGYGTEFIGWDHRLQMSKTKDGKKIFFIWADSEGDKLTATVSWDGIGYINNLPNIYGYAKDIENTTNTYLIEYTSLTNAAYIGFWHYVSEYVTEYADGYQAPVVITPVLSPYSLNPDKPVVHYFLPGIIFMQDDFKPQSVSVPKVDGVDVSNYPNPFHTQTTFELILQQSESVVLSVYDLSGRLMDEVNYGKLFIGEYQLNYNRNNLSNGLYMYSIKTSTTFIKGKFIVY